MNFLNSFSNFGRNFFQRVSSIASFFTITQLGADIYGEASEDLSGRSVSMNAAGNIIAIGARGNDGTTGSASDNRGHVRIYSWSGTAWNQMGGDIDGKFALDLSGDSVSINAAGDRVAIGAYATDGISGADSGHARIYQWSGTAWNQMGNDIDGEAAGDWNGFSVSMNDAGNRVAIGARNNAAGGHTRIYSWSGTAWNQMGDDIDGEAAGDESGYSVSMNAVGDRVAIGAISNDGTSGSTSDGRGHVRVYSWSGTAWNQLGGDIDGDAAGDRSGISVSMNATGDRVAIGASFHETTDRGHTRIYSWNGSTWNQMGGDIDGEADGDRSGQSVSMNAVGDIVAISSPSSGASRGSVRIYSWNGTSWMQLFADIDGANAGEQFGLSVSMNDVGDKFVVGAPSNDISATNAGSVRVYSIQDLRPKSWVRLGADIDGEAFGDQSGYSVSMNAAGDRMAIGAIYNDGISGTDRGHVRIYQWSGTAWNQMGMDIDGEADGDLSGSSVSMNAVGDRVAIGAIGNDGTRGHVRIYSWSGTAWNQMGDDIDGEAAGDQSGHSVSMNAAGDRVAIGAMQNNGIAGTYSGHVRIYQWSGTAWNQMGNDIDGEVSFDRSGASVSMNATGDRMAIGAIYNDGSASNSGHVRIYQWSGTAWNQMGDDIDGEAAGDSSGWSVSMNAAGDRVAIGATSNDGTSGSTSDGRGHVRIYSWSGTAWNQLGSDIDGEATTNGSGISVSMNATGDRVAIGARGASGTAGSTVGHVRIYSLSGTAWTQLGADIDGEYPSDRSGNSVSMNAAGDRVVIGASLNDGVFGTSSDRGHARVYNLIF